MGQRPGGWWWQRAAYSRLAATTTRGARREDHEVRLEQGAGQRLTGSGSRRAGGLPVAEAVDETAEEAAFAHEGGLRRGSGGALPGDGLVIVGTRDSVDYLGLVEVLRTLDQRHVPDEDAIQHDLGLKARGPVGIPLGLAPARQRHPHTKLAVPSEQVSVNAAIPKGVNHPARLELIHIKTVTPVPEESLNTRST